MTVRRFALLVTLLLPAAPATAQSLAFTDVTVIDVVEGAAVPGQTIIVSGDRIAAVGRSGELAVPDGATIVDGSGRFLIPGLWDMHIHMVNDVAEPVPWDFHNPGPEADDPRDIYMPVYLAYGIVGVREMSGGLASIEQRERVERGEMLGPHIVIGSPLLDGPQPVFSGRAGRLHRRSRAGPRARDGGRGRDPDQCQPVGSGGTRAAHRRAPHRHRVRLFES